MTPARRRTAAEEARTLVAEASAGTLATAGADGSPWASLVAYATLDDGAPVLLVSTFAEHGRNLASDSRASLSVAEEIRSADVLDRGRVTLAGVAERTDDEAALATFQRVHPFAETYAGFDDFSCWVLRVERARWVGGYGRMDSVDAVSYRAAEPDPVAGSAASAARHMNADHADALLAMARTLGGIPDAERAVCTGCDRYGLDLEVHGPDDVEAARVAFAEPCTEPGGLRAAAVELTRRARAA